MRMVMSRVEYNIMHPYHKSYMASYVVHRIDSIHMTRFRKPSRSRRLTFDSVVDAPLKNQ